jgi:hypothetical protein
LGFERNNVELSMDANEQQKMKLINWNKTRSRYNQAVVQSNLESVFNVESEEEDL